MDTVDNLLYFFILNESIQFLSNAQGGDVPSIGPSDYRKGQRLVDKVSG